MKKIFAAALAMAFGLSAFGVTPSLVYDYKASFKRIDATYKIRVFGTGESKAKKVSNQYSVKSDTIRGYVVLPACVACNVDGGVTKFNDLSKSSWFQNIDPETVVTDPEDSRYDPTLFLGNEYGYAYLTRTGDKLSQKKLPSGDVTRWKVAKVPVYASVGTFGSFIDITEGYDRETVEENRDENPYVTPWKDIYASNKAWMKLEFRLPNAQPLPTALVLKNVVVGEPLTYGFYGLDNTIGGQVMNAGFGTVKKVTWKEAADLGWCEIGVESEDQCRRIDRISGSMIGNPRYQGACYVTPMWDLCWRKGAQNETQRSELQGVVAGTWTLRYNSSLSKKTGAELKAALEGKLKVTEPEKQIEEVLNRN